MPHIRAGKRGVNVIPKNIRERLGTREGMLLDVSIEDDTIILRIHDLWSELGKRGRKLGVDIDEAEKEINEDDELWLKQ